MIITQSEIGEIQALLENSTYDEIVIETVTERFTLRRSTNGWVQETAALSQPVLLFASKAPVEADTVRTASAREIDDGLAAVRAPLPGTFYRAPKPGAASFVEVGARVTKDTIIGIVETMKLMNPVPAGVAGEIAEICIANGTFVDVSEILVRVKAHEGRAP